MSIPLVICQSFYFCQLLFSLFFLVWNVLVAVALISVARTHTIDIRRFMCELAYDAHLHDKHFRKNFYNPKSTGFKDNLKGNASAVIPFRTLLALKLLTQIMARGKLGVYV